jgi:hypothetical protein
MDIDMEYRGTWITIRAVAIQDGWTWHYSIAGGPTRISGGKPLPSEVRAELLAMDFAREEVDAALALLTRDGPAWQKEAARKKLSGPGLPGSLGREPMHKPKASIVSLRTASR